MPFEEIKSKLNWIELRSIWRQKQNLKICVHQQGSRRGHQAEGFRATAATGSRRTGGQGVTDILTITSALNVAFFGLLSYVSGKMPGGEMVKRGAAVAVAMMALNAAIMAHYGQP